VPSDNIRIDLQDALAALRPPDRTDIVVHRAAVAAGVRREAAQLDPQDVLISDVHVPDPGGRAPSLRLRLYRPAGAAPPHAGVLWMHGGAFSTGLPEACDRIARDIVAALGVAVVSPDYRLAPEFPFPAAFEDCLRALTWMRAEDGLGLGRVAVAGASAGGTLAAALALHARDDGQPLSLQLLLYPPLDDRQDGDWDQRYARTPIITSDDTRTMWRRYLPADEPVSPYAVPGRAADLSGLAPAYLCLADNDPLRDEGLEYARRLIRSGVPTELHHLPGTFHGFDAIAPDAPTTRAVVDSYLAALRAALLDDPVVAAAPQ
jgi:acetyl esterase